MPLRGEPAPARPGRLRRTPEARRLRALGDTGCRAQFRPRALAVPSSGPTCGSPPARAGAAPNSGVMCRTSPSRNSPVTTGSGPAWAAASADAISQTVCGSPLPVLWTVNEPAARPPGPPSIPPAPAGTPTRPRREEPRAPPRRPGHLPGWDRHRAGRAGRDVQPAAACPGLRVRGRARSSRRSRTGPLSSLFAFGAVLTLAGAAMYLLTGPETPLLALGALVRATATAPRAGADHGRVWP